MGNLLMWQYPPKINEWDKVHIQRSDGISFTDLVTLEIGQNEYFDEDGETTNTYRKRYIKTTGPVYDSFVTVSAVSVYSTPYNVRLQLPNLLLEEIIVSNISGSSLILPKNIFGIYKIEKNGTIMPTDEFTFTRPRSVSLDDAATTSDNFIVTALVGVSDSVLVRLLIDVSREVDDHIAQRVTLPTTIYKSLFTIVAELAAAKFYERFPTPNDDNMRKSKDLLKVAESHLEAHLNTWYKKVFLSQSNETQFIDRSFSISSSTTIR
jgi:hypothetical protein